MTGPYIVLIHSPLTGPSFWMGVHDVLWTRGQRTLLGRLPAPQHVHPPYWLTHAAGVAAMLPTDGRFVLVAHSGAGPLLPAIGKFLRNHTGECALGYVFVDSDLPRDGACRFELFDDSELADQWRRRSARGWLPSWTSAELAPLIADGALRDRFVGELPRVPTTVYEELISVPDEWPDAPCGYLALSGGYRAAAAAAADARWPLRMLDAHHLLPLVEPEVVADTLLGLVAEVIG